MDYITLKEYAEKKHISYEAVRKQVIRYQDELKDHIIGGRGVVDRIKVTDKVSKTSRKSLKMIEKFSVCSVYTCKYIYTQKHTHIPFLTILGYELEYQTQGE